MKSLFVSGTDTEVGKTWVSSHLLRRLRRDGHRVGAWKPVCSGVVNTGEQSYWEDIQALANAISGIAENELFQHSPDLIERICPQRFKLPMAPNIAAVHEGRTVSDTLLLNGPGEWREHADLLLAEGAGGLLSPASDTLLGADLLEQLQMPVLLVAANRLGTIHQTLATVESARSRDLKVVGVILNQVDRDVSEVLRQSNESELRRLLPDVQLLTTHFDESKPFDDSSLRWDTWFVESDYR